MDPYRAPQELPPPPGDPMLRVLVITGGLAAVAATLVLGLGLWDAHRPAAAATQASSDASPGASSSANAKRPLPPLKTHLDPLAQAGYCHAGWCWEDPFPTGADMVAVAAKPNDTWIAGAQGTGSLLMHWDGVKLTPSDAAEAITSLARAGVTVWATTRAGTILTLRGESLVDGGAVSREPLRAIWAAADDDVWAVGDGGAILHYDGAHWSPSRSPTKAKLMGVRGRAANDVWAVGDAIILHWDGHAWSVAHRVTAGAMKQPDPAESGGFTCGNPLLAVRSHNAALLEVRDAMPLGAKDVWFSAGSGRAIHWDGRRWSDVDLGEIAGMWGAAPNDAWLIGWRGIRHWDGATWSEAIQSSEPLVAIDGAGPRDVWAVGRRGHVVHFDGTKWTALERTTGIKYNALWVGDGVAWGGGEGGLARRDAAGWHEVPALFRENNAVNAVGGTRASDVWVFGRFHEPVHFDGTTWTPSDGKKTAVFQAAAPAADDVWAWGGPLQHWDGATWTTASSDQIMGLWAPSKGVAWATAHPHIEGGKSGTMGEFDFNKRVLLRWDKTQWTTVGDASSDEIGGAEGEPWLLAGSDVVRREGNAWKKMFSLPPEPDTSSDTASGLLSRVSVSSSHHLRVLSPKDVWVSDWRGLEHWDGSTLTPIPIPLSNPAIVVSGPDTFAYSTGGIMRRAH